MVRYEHDEVFPFPRDRVWQLLRDHTDDTRISRIHPLIRQQRTIGQTGASTTLERSIDARGRLLSSQWRYTARPPDMLRWEIVAGTGPYALGSWMENTYSEAAGGTRIQSRGELRITVVPFFLPQGTVLKRVLETIDAEDQTYLRG
ncbi:MAG TPA: SRPBCC family protein [Thermoplasmata archaeon]|nr:SRPBCC family protein [Thermoplasmata archaeon]